MSIGKRVWFRRVVIIAVAVVLLGLAYVPTASLYGSIKLKRAIAADKGLNLDPAAYDKPEVPAKENGAKWIQAGADAFVWSDEVSGVIADATLTPYSQWSPEQRAATRRVLAQQKGALEILHRAAAMHRSNYGIEFADGFDGEMPDYLAIMKAARVLMAEVRVADADGDEAETLLALGSLSAIAESLQREGELLGSMIGIACERLLLVAMGEVVSGHQPWASQPEFLAELEGVVPAADRAETLGRTVDAWTAIVVSGLPPQNWSFSKDRDTRFLSLPPFAALAGVEALRVQRRVTGLMDVPYGRSPESFAPPVKPSFLKPYKRAVVGDETTFVTAVSRAQSVAAQRMLVRAAIRVRGVGGSDGAYPSQRPQFQEFATADPFTDRPLLYELRSDGSAVVSLDNVTPLLEQTILKLAADAVVPIELPKP